MTALLEHIELQPDQEPVASVIWLHGLGADGHDFEPIVPELNLPDTLPIRFIFPHAPIRPVSINGGDEMRAWYDFSFHSDKADDNDITTSSEHVLNFIEQEIARGIPSHKIVLAGFSQGGVIALHTAIRCQHRLAGVVALSTYLNDFASSEKDQSDSNLAIPILMAHGAHDQMIPIGRAATSRENLIRLGYDVRWFDYPMEHQVCLEEITEVSNFFQEIL
jgi:phospholipase/carboxylesterase